MSGVLQGGFIGPNFHINPCQAFTRISTFAQAHAHTCGCHTSFHLCFATHPISMVSFSPEANCEKLVNYSGHATVKDGNKINPVAVAVIRWGGLPGIFYIFHSLNVNILTRKQGLRGTPNLTSLTVHLQIDRPVFNLSSTLQAWYHLWSHTTLSFVTASHTIVLCYYFHTSFLPWTRFAHFISCPAHSFPVKAIHL